MNSHDMNSHDMNSHDTKSHDTKSHDMNLHEPRRFYLITQPRTASNLLVKILALDKQEAVVSSARQGGYYFLNTFFVMGGKGLLSKTIDEWTQAEKDEVLQNYSTAVGELEAHLAAGEDKGKIVFAKEHAALMIDPVARARYLGGQTAVQEPPWTMQFSDRFATEMTHSSDNDTLFPDSFLETWLPTFLIRHPALSFPSLYRARLDLEKAELLVMDGDTLAFFMTLHWSRSLYDWYAQRLSTSKLGSHRGVSWPLVLDGDDLINEPQTIVRFSELIGLDSAKLQWTWSAASEDEVAKLPKISQKMLESLSASTGVLEDKSPASIDIDTEAKKWRGEFGEERGAMMEKWVRDAMPDYEFLKAKRLRPKSVGN